MQRGDQFLSLKHRSQQYLQTFQSDGNPKASSSETFWTTKSLNRYHGLDFGLTRSESGTGKGVGSVHLRRFLDKLSYCEPQQRDGIPSV